jgi:hypothetical protein
MNLKKNLIKQYNEYVSELNSNVDKIIKSKSTVRRHIVDFPAVQQYLHGVFPDVDVSDIPIYLTTPGIMRKYGMYGCMGCYVTNLKVIVMQNIITTKYKLSDKFSQLLQDEMKIQVDVEDVVVHEMLHAISHKINRPGRKFTFNEEEFVYTNCVDFYRKKMSEDAIVSGTMLPFCVNDIMKDKSAMIKIWEDIGYPKIYSLPAKKITEIANRHPVALVHRIIDAAKDRAAKMIKLYEQYGRQSVNANVAPDDGASLRIQFLDIDDCDI